LLNLGSILEGFLSFQKNAGKMFRPEEKYNESNKKNKKKGREI